MRLIRRLIVAVAFLLFGRRRRRPAEVVVPDVRRRDVATDPRAERGVAVLLLLAAACFVAFVVLYVVWDDTQVLGAALGLGFACLSAALVVAGKRVALQETEVEERPRLVQPDVEDAAAMELARGADGLSRRRLLAGAAGAAGATLGAALVVPAASLGPAIDGRVDRTPWRRGRRIVDDEGRPVIADDVVIGTFVTGYPAGADRRELGSPIVLVRLPPASLRLPEGRAQAAWAPEGILAYSKICTHAGCAIALYRYPLDAEIEPRPALVCPCHYSTFDPARGAERIFGPAGRPLPQLPLMIEPGSRALLAGGGFSASIGPAWWGTRRD